ncbi:hypothetical protein BZH87_10655 [Salmonella enterica]|nr:hypothetical protein [Salmonella enterica]EBE8492189.1 hypothetical protein [Salmonella enterica]EBR1859463.1 helix-turn-helix domain-containing protein [Salmonella enterica]ECH9069388.1 hypothetical protein [Salmonella enterica subsp. enterica]EED3332873.1 helix-turn-helix domain-containing protein [Salmonella enterica subsp. enterica]
MDRQKRSIECFSCLDILTALTGEASPEQWAQAGRLIGAGVPRQRVAIIYDVGLSTLYRKFPSGYR